MKMLTKLQDKLSGLYDALSRYPITVVFLTVAAVVNTMAINQEEDYTRYLLTFLIGASLGFTLQGSWERFFSKMSYRIVLIGVCMLLTLGYYLIVRQDATTGIETWIRTSVALFALLIAFVWVPVIKSTVSFNESFMAVFKAFFIALLFSGVLFIGTTLIIEAIDLLLFRVPEKSYLHALNIIGVLFAPIYFLSLIPVYPGFSDQFLTTEALTQRDEKTAKSCTCPKFLEILISYIIIPLLSIYTIILVIYIAINITGNFWTDNRLEPMLVGFAIAVILVCILASNLENRFAELFRKIFPKIMVLTVLFQIVSSILRTQDTGITFGRYYVILFGIFAGISGILLSFINVRKNGIIAALLIGFSVISIIPPMDAFTISRANQEDMLKSVLIQNNMLQNDTITPNPSVPEDDKKTISNTLNYLVMMDYTKTIPYLEPDFDPYNDFYETFGFYRYEESLYRQESIYLMLDQHSPINISGYDTFCVVNFYFQEVNPETVERICEFDKNGKTYTMTKENAPDPGLLSLSDEKGQVLISVNMKDVFESFDTAAVGAYQISKESMPAVEATITQENDKAAISLVAMNLNIDKSNSKQPYSGDFYVIIKIK